MREDLEFKLEEESTKSNELEETCAKIREGASCLEIPVNAVVIAMKEISQFDCTC